MNEPRDLASYLPLSIRPAVDETAVDADWDARLGDLEKLVAAFPAASAGEFAARVARARRRRRVRIGDLGAALVAAYEQSPQLVAPPSISGPVALARALSAPTPIRAVVRGRTLRASDAGWEFGRGPELVGTARELVMLLYGRGPVPGS